MPAQRADRRDDRCGPAREDLADVSAVDALAPFVDVDTTFLDLVTKLRRERRDRVPGYSFEDRAGELGRHHGAVVEHEPQVHAAELLDPTALDRVEEQDLLAAVRDGLL